MSSHTHEARVQGLGPTEELHDVLWQVDIAEHDLRTVTSGHVCDRGELDAFHLLRSCGSEMVEISRMPPGSDAADPEEGQT